MQIYIFIYIFIFLDIFLSHFLLPKKKYHIKKFNCSYKYLHNKQIHATERGYNSSNKNQAAFIPRFSFHTPFTTKI